MENQITALTPIEIASIAETPGRLIALAISNGTPPETLAKLLDLSERWEAMKSRKEFVIAMSEFKKAAPPAIIKQSTVDFSTQKGRTNYNYANLGDIVQQVTPLLSKHGLHLCWQTETPEGNKPIKVTCHLTHKDGHRESVTLSGPADQSGNKNAIQAIGSALTYLQRYSCLAILGLATMEDDDGRGGDDAPPKRNDNANKTNDLAQQLRSNFPQGQHGTVKEGGKPGDAPTQPAGSSTPVTWEDMTEQQKFTDVLAKVMKITSATDPVVGLKRCSDMGRWIADNSRQFTSEHIAMLNAEITAAERALQSVPDEEFPAADDGSVIKMLDGYIQEATTAERVAELTVNWEADKDTLSKGIFRNGIEMLHAAKKRFQ